MDPAPTRLPARSLPLPARASIPFTVGLPPAWALAVGWAVGLAVGATPSQGWSQVAGEAGATSTVQPPAATAAALPSPLPLPRTQGPVTLDGVVSDEEWGHVKPFPVTTFSPAFLAPTTEDTELRVMYDDEYLYVSGRLYDSEPHRITTNTFYRDQYSGDDIMALVLDSYNDHETAVWFVTNPAGARDDRALSRDAVGGPNTDWNAHWEVATRETGEGWFAEFRIPFSSFRFQPVDGQVTMGLIVYRYIARKNERHTFPVMDPARAGLAFAKPSGAHRVVLEGVEASRPLYVTPYALGGVQQFPRERVGTVDGAGGVAPSREWSTSSTSTQEAGVDLRFAPTSNLALDLTLNTDFAQVEADNQQINLTRFPTFFPEKRQFFQERASTFQFEAGGGQSRLFHSRRIGLQDGEIVRIYGGARAVGRVGGTDYGVLAMQTAPHEATTSTTTGVARVSQRVLNAYSSVGGMVTTRLGTGGEDNVGIGVDAVLRPVGEEWLTVKWARTFDQTLPDATALGAGLLEARWQRIREGGVTYLAEYIRVGGDYLPRLGFQARRDFQATRGQLQYKRFLPGDSPLRTAGAGISGEQFVSLSSGAAESRSIQPQVEVEFNGGTSLTVGATSAFENVLRPYSAAGAVIEAGEYWFHQGEARLMLSRSAPVRGNVNLSVGQFYDGNLVGAALNPTWNPSRHLELSGRYEVNHLSFPERGLSTTAHLFRLNSQAALNTRVFASVLAQFSNQADLVTLNARFRYHLREGTDLWIVYNEGLNTDRDFGSPPRLPRSSGRTLMLKYTHALIW